MTMAGPMPLSGLASDKLRVLGEVSRRGEMVELSPAARAVWIALAIGFAGDDGRCWPSRKAIGKAAVLGRSAVSQAVAELIDRGWLKRLGRPYPGQNTRYQVLVPVLRRVHADGLDSDAQGRERGPEPVHAAGPDDATRVHAHGRTRPREWTNAPTTVGAEQKPRTENQQQEQAAAATKRPDEQAKPSLHPKVQRVAERFGIDAKGQSRLAAIEGLDLVIDELAREAAGGTKPAGLLIRLAESPETTKSIERAQSREQRRLDRQRDAKRGAEAAAERAAKRKHDLEQQRKWLEHSRAEQAEQDQQAAVDREALSIAFWESEREAGREAAWVTRAAQHGVFGAELARWVHDTSMADAKRDEIRRVLSVEGSREPTDADGPPEVNRSKSPHVDQAEVSVG